MASANTDDLLHLTAQIVSAHLGKSQVSAEGLTSLIHSVHAALAEASDPVPAEPERPQPAVPVKRSVFPDHIVCLEDGKKLKTLKRHLRVSFDMTPDQYRERWGLPSDYPMVAPNYAGQRSALAKSIGLGRKRAPGKAEPDPAPAKPSRKGRAKGA